MYTEANPESHSTMHSTKRVRISLFHSVDIEEFSKNFSYFDYILS